MEGTLQIRNDDLFNLLDLLMRNLLERPTFLHQGALSRARWILRSISQFNSSGRSKKNAAHHYDLSHQFYRIFLDSDMQYSCAYFSNDADNIDQAQGKKKALVAKKLLIEPGHRVLDIGCGWGGMGLHLNRHHGAHVTGVMLSRGQLEVAQRRASAESRRSTPEFRLEDYREVRGTFDRIVSVGMFEHVGTPHYREFFTHLRDRLASDGIALVHTIGRSGPPSATDAWTAKHIFPGGYCPALSEVATAVERSGLIITDIEVLRLHYARTLKAWRSRFEVRLSDVRRLYDDRFCRMWRYYLAASELVFRRGGHVVFQLQLQLTRRQDVVSVTCDYLLDASGNSERLHCTEMPTAGVQVLGLRAGTRSHSGSDLVSETPA